MNSSSLPVIDSHLLPPVWKASALSQLTPQENVLACLEVDLDAQLHFASGLLIVTDQRLISAQGGVNSQVEWSSWDLKAGMAFEHHDHAGVGTLSLVDATPAFGELALHALSHNVTAMRLQEIFAKRIEVLTHGEPLNAKMDARCPQCKLTA